MDDNMGLLLGRILSRFRKHNAKNDGFDGRYRTWLRMVCSMLLPAVLSFGEKLIHLSSRYLDSIKHL